MFNLHFVGKKDRNLKILCLGAHGDDIEIGCGGTILRVLSEYKDVEVHWIVLGCSKERRKEAFGSARKFLASAKSSNITVKDFKDVLLELGGKSPNIVFDDANLDDAVNGAISGIFAASGQTCIAGSRLLLQDSIYDAFVERLVAVAGTARMGDPQAADTQVGPVTTRAQYEKVLDFIEMGRQDGAVCALGGKAAHKIMNFSLGPDIDSSRRLVQQQDARPGQEHAGEDDLLLVAAA